MDVTRLQEKDNKVNAVVLHNDIHKWMFYS